MSPTQPSSEVSAPVEKIGDAKHGGRNVIIVVGLLAAAAALGGYYAYQGHTDGPKLAALADFRAAYATKCDVAEFRGATPAYVSTEYLNHDDLQALVAKQRAALDATPCGDIDHALRAGGFPLTAARPQ